MLPEQSSPLALSQLLDALPDSVIWMKALRDESNRVVDFQIEYANQQALAAAKDVYQVKVGTRVLADNQHDRALIEKSVGEMGLVLETNQPLEFDYFNTRLQRWFLMNWSKVGDGILSVTRDISALKAAEQASIAHRNQQTDLLNSVLNGSINGIMAFEAIRNETGVVQDFNCLLVNQAACRMVGKSADELTGSTLLTHFPGNRQTGLFDKYAHTTNTGEPTRTEIDYKHDGLDVWFDISAQKLGDGFVVTFTDTSVIKRAQQRIEQSAADLRTVIDSAQVAIFLLHPVRNEAGRIVDFWFRMANQMFAHYVNQEPDALTGKLVSHWFPSYKTNGLFSRYVAIYETGRTQHFSFHFNADGIDIWESVTATKLGNDVLVTFSDYTELKKLQQRLEASTAELQTIIDTSQTGIFLFSPVRTKTGEVIDFRFRVANRQLASYVGQEPDAVVGALGSKWFPDYKTNGLFEAYHKTYATGEPQRFDFHYDGSGIDVWLDIMSTKIGDEVLVTFGDYTPLKLLQQQLEKSVVELQRSNKNLEQFAYVASHDLQEPLRKIQAFGDIIQQEYASAIGDQGSDLIRRMQSAAARMQMLIKDVLAYSRTVTKREAIGPVDLSRLVTEVLSDLDTVIADKQAIVRVDPLPTVGGDAAQLRQLFQNLVSNALKFAKPQGQAEPPTIILTTRRIRGRELVAAPISASDADQEFHLISVADNGIGFDPRQAERIFQVFQRLHSRSAYQGTGIGLAIVQKVIDNHHGYIVAEGRPGEGATFRVLLPV
ncbi:PAS domain-containing sensor histidine kinase [Spirosoma areae]